MRLQRGCEDKNAGGAKAGHSNFSASPLTGEGWGEGETDPPPSDSLPLGGENQQGLALDKAGEERL